MPAAAADRELASIGRFASVASSSCVCIDARAGVDEGACIDERACISCALCVDWCPTECLTMDHFRLTPAPTRESVDLAVVAD